MVRSPSPPPSPPPDQQTVTDIIRHRGEVRAEAPALIAHGRETVTYGGLVRRMDAIRRSLNQCGFGRADRIAILHSGGIDMALLMLGVISGGTALPVNPNYTAQEMEADLRKRGAQALLVETALDTPGRGVAERLGIPVIEMSPGDGRPDDGPMLSGGVPGREHDAGLAQPEDAIAVHLTAGTTGQGKVVPTRHRQFQQFEQRSGESDCIYLFGPLYYASRPNTLIKCLVSGSSVILASSFDVEDFYQFLAAYGVTQLNGSPSVLTLIHDHAGAHRGSIEKSKLAAIYAQSGKLDPEIADQLEGIFHAPVLECYSTSETSRIFSNPLPPGRRKRGTVGLPLGCEAAILSADGAFLDAGQRGEVLVKGPQVFDGYENDSQANAEAFVDGWFRTGDEGFLDEDGYLTLTGRIKEMINRGGEKVSPSEVDAALMSHEAVREAACFPIDHPTLGEEVAAAVVREPGSALTGQDLTAYLRDHLAGFKIPRRLVFVDEIPLSDAGKIQRYALAAQLGIEDGASIDAGEAPDRAASPLEARLAEIWQRRLELDHVGLHDNFFLLGGDSLQAVELFQEVEKTLRTRLPVAALFEAGTVAEMAELIEKAGPQGCMVAIQTAISPAGAKPPFFCVHGNGGEVIGFYNLARHLGDDQPFYGIQSPGWDGGMAPFTSSTRMAAHYVAEMRKVQPRGPYYLGGYSFGGRVAVYMAGILKNQGQEVALLALLDPSNRTGRIHATLGLWLERNEATTPLGVVRQTARFAWFRLCKVCDGLYDRIRRGLLFPVWNHYRGSGKTMPRFLRRPDRANRLVRIEHGKMPPYGGDAVQFRANFTPHSTAHPDIRDAWDQVIKGTLTVVPIPGWHHQIIQEPYAQDLARELAAALEIARAKSGTDPN